MKRASLLILDIASFWMALLITLSIRYSEGLGQQYDLHVLPFAMLAVLWVAVLYINNLYDPATLRNNTFFYSHLIASNAIAGVIATSFFYLIPLFQITPKTNLFIFIGIFTLLSLGIRSLFNGTIETRFKKHAAIVGINPQSLELARHLRDNPQLGYRLMYVVDIKQSADHPADLPVRNVTDIESDIRAEKLEAIIISPEAYQVQGVVDFLFKSLEHRVNFYNLASFYEKVTGKVPLGAINQIWFLENITEETRKAYEMVKRTFDVVLAILLGIAFLPFLVLIAMAIKLTSRGAVFYRQKRLGRGGKTFEMIKLRTMRSDAEKSTGAVWAAENDPRITPIGRFLRKTRLDELPQTWNILRGDMSFVGPRSERPEFSQMLTREVPFYEERYLIKPGATGWAQLQKSYYSSVTDTAEKLQYDLYYIKNRSLILDIGILLKTINLIIRGGGR